MFRLFIATSVALVMMVLVVSSISRPAMAQSSDTCSASVNSAPANGSTIKVPKDGTLLLNVVAPPQTVTNNTSLELPFGLKKSLPSAPAGGNWSGTVNVKDYSKYGVGLYKVAWQSLNANGDVSCTVSTNIDIEGNPLLSAIGATAAAAMTIGLAGFVFKFGTTINESAKWALKVLFRAKVATKAGQPGIAVNISRSFGQTLWSTLQGTLFGILLGAGSWAMAWQTGLSLPSVSLSFTTILPFTILGFVLGMVKNVLVKPKVKEAITA